MIFFLNFQMPGMKPKEGMNGEEMETEWRPSIYVLFMCEMLRSSVSWEGIWKTV